MGKKGRIAEMPWKGKPFRYLYGEKVKWKRACEFANGRTFRVIQKSNDYCLRMKRLDRYPNLKAEGGELHFTNMWCHMVCPLISIQPVDGTDSMDVVADPTIFKKLMQKPGKKPDYLDHIENVEAFLDEPGEWFLDKNKSLIRLILPSDEEKITIPFLNKLVSICSPSSKSSNNSAKITFEGIQFQHTDDSLTDKFGHEDIQANFSLCDSGMKLVKGEWQAEYDEWKGPPASMELNAPYQVLFSNCGFSQLANTGLRIGSNCKDFSGIKQCSFEQIMGNGIEFGGVSRQDHHGKSIGKNFFIRQCSIQQVGADFTGSVGIFGGYTDGLSISHNFISDLPYTGISLGWGWGSVDTNGRETPGAPLFNVPSNCRKNIVSFNLIERVMQLRRDGAGIYTLGSMPGTRIFANHLRLNTKAEDIYLDEFSTGISVDSNLIESVGNNTSINLNNIEKNKYLQNQFVGNVMNNQIKLKKKVYNPDVKELTPEKKAKIQQFVLDQTKACKPRRFLKSTR